MLRVPGNIPQHCLPLAAASVATAVVTVAATAKLAATAAAAVTIAAALSRHTLR